MNTVQAYAGLIFGAFLSDLVRDEAQLGWANSSYYLHENPSGDCNLLQLLLRYPISFLARKMHGQARQLVSKSLYTPAATMGRVLRLRYRSDSTMKAGLVEVEQKISGIFPNFDAAGCPQVLRFPATRGEANQRNVQLARSLGIPWSIT